MTAEEILAILVAFDTTSHKSNLPLVAWVEAYLENHGVASHRVHDGTGEKANLIATTGPADVPGIVLSGHVDTVPVTGQDWATDPFAATVVGDRIHGRGTTDMKGFCACVLAAVPRMVAAPLAVPLHIVLSYDEEVGCLGVRGALREIAQWPVRPRACIVGEPTGMQVVIGHKSKRAMRATVRGATGHSSLAPGFVNAVEYAARLAVFISDTGRGFAAGGAVDPLYDLGHSTAHVGVLRGGTQLNIVPDEAVLDFEFRTIGGDDADALVERVAAFARGTLEPEMRAVHPGAGIGFELLSAVDGLDTPPDADVVGFAKALARRNDHAKVAFGTEGGLFRSMAGIPTVVVGPGDIARAHKADEYIERAELAEGSAFVERLVDRCRA